MMNGYEWKPGTSPVDEANGAYWERNMLALDYAFRVNAVMKLAFAAMHAPVPQECLCGWFADTDNNWDGWHRVISLNGGEMCFHIPDDFDIGTLPEIEKNWDGHTTRQKWNRVAKNCGCEPIKWED